MAEINFTNSLTYAGWGKDILNPLITSLFDQDIVSAEYSTDLESKLWFKYTQALTPDQKFSVMVGAYELDDITEWENLPEMEISRGEDKGFEIKQHGNKIGITKLFKAWIMSAKDLDGADSSVKMERAKLASNIIALRRGRQKKMNIEMTSVLTKGWDASGTGAGSPTPYGKALFATDHPVRSGELSFDNTVTSDGVLTKTRLQTALNKQKAELMLQNGDRIMTPSSYKLVVSRKGAVAAREILNTAWTRATTFSADGNNSSAMNVFDFEGNTVEIVENPFMGYKERNWGTIGTDDYWFLCNSEASATAGGARMISLYEADVRVWENKENGNTYVSLDMGFATDHYGLESFVVWSRGLTS